MDRVWVASSIYSNNHLYWDLGVAVSNSSNKLNIANSIELSTFHRIEGLKKYYLDDFYGAIFHFEELNNTNKRLVLYEYINSYYLVGDFNKALLLFNDFNDVHFSDNMLYLKSKVLTIIGDYKAAISVLNNLINYYPDSDYSDIIQFDLEKINLLR